MRALGAALLALALLFHASPAVAQVGQAEIAGVITDTTGGVLPGTSVTATLASTGAVRSTTSDSNGRYRFNQLRVGTYQLRAELPGFVTVILAEVRLNVGQSAVLDVQMKVATVEETITVQGEAPQVDVTKSELSGNITDLQVRELPVLGRNWLGFALLAPGMKSDGSEGIQDSAPTAGMAVGRQDRVVLDGADLNNRSTASNVDLRISKEVIAEFEVKTTQFDAQLGQSGTSIIQAISRSGTDEFRGNGYLYFRDDALNARDPFTPRKEPFRNEQYGGTIGGPIVKGKTHFFVNYERQNEPKTVSSNTGIAGLDTPVDGEDRRNLFFARVDHALTANHRLSGRYNYYTRFEPHSGTGGLTPPVASLDNDWKVRRWNGALNSVFAEKWVSQLTLNYMNTDRLFGKRPNSGALHVFPSVSLGGNVGGGFEDPNYWALREDLSVFFNKGGQHNVKLGGYFERAYLKGFFLFAVNGVFSYTRDPANLAACCASENQAEWDKSRFPIPVSFSQVLGDPGIDAPNKIASAYVQDDWTIHPRLTLNLGLRYDVEFGSLANNLDDALLQQPYGNDLDNLQPRLGFAWDLTGDKRTIVRGGVGRFVTQTFLNATFFVERTNRVRQLNITVRNTSNDPNFARDPFGGRTFQDFKALIGNPQFPLDIAIFDTATEQPDLWSYSLGVARQIGHDLSVSADYVHQRSNSMLRSVDTNAFCCRPDGNAFPVVSGVFPELGGAVVGRGRPDPRFNSIRVFGNDGKARYNGLQVAVDKRFSGRFSFGATYLASRNKGDFNDVFDYPSNNFNLGDEYSDGLFDQRHRFTANWVSNLPGGFSFSGLFFAASGRALAPTVGGLDLYATAPEPRGRSARPTCGVDPRFNPGCRALGIPNGTRVPRNSFRSASVYRLDLRVARVVKAGRHAIEPSFELFNVFNRRNLDPTTYNTNLGSARFGLAGRSRNLPYLPRQVQLGIRYSF